VTTVKDGTLVIDQRNAVGAWAAIHPKAECHADIVTTSLIAVNASGAGDVHLGEADWSDLAQVGLTGAGQIVVDGVITAPDLALSSHGAGELFVNGITGDSLTIEITGSGIAGITGTAALAGPAAGTLAPGASRGLGPAGSGSIVTTHGDHRLGRGFDGRGRWCRFGSCGFGHSLIGLRRIAILGALLRGFRRSGGIRSSGSICSSGLLTSRAFRGRRLRGQLV
jgi:hypothetical protein